MISLQELLQARTRISAHITHTSLTYDAAQKVYIKWENQQVTGSFKARGALNKVLSLSDHEREAGLVAASAGNHGQGLALAAKITAAPVEVFVSESAADVKVQAMRAMGASIHVVSGGYPQAESAGRAYAQQHGKTWVSPYNDAQVVAGQGTIGLELQEDLSENTVAWLIPVSGGGLIVGIGLSIREQAKRPRLIGVQAEASPFMHSLFYHDTQKNVPDLPSLADGLTGEVEDNALTIPLVKQLVNEIVLVSEKEIAHAMAYAWRAHGQKIEGSGAVGLAAVLSGKVTVRPLAVVVSGGNVGEDVLTGILDRFSGETQ
ncbi:MAG: threonine ammonia-lyase [Anaerolineales bacterium]